LRSLRLRLRRRSRCGSGEGERAHADPMQLRVRLAAASRRMALILDEKATHAVEGTTLDFGSTAEPQIDTRLAATAVPGSPPPV